MNKCAAKHTNTVNETLYLPRVKGGRGMKSLECSYKDIKIKSAMKLKQNKDPRMCLVNQFHQRHLQSNSYSLFKEAMRYCEEKGLDAECDDEELVISTGVDEVRSSEEKCNEKVKTILKTVNGKNNLQVVLACNWQGVILKSIIEDETRMKDSFYWLSNWKTCPTSTISELMSLLYQTLNTLCYKYHTIPAGTEYDTTCRLCKKGQESVKHLLSNCSELAKHVYLQRHNNAIKCFFNFLLRKCGFINEIPPWFTSIDIKPQYENEQFLINSDVPEYSGRDGESIRDAARPDGKIVMKKEKKIFLFEQTVPWITNRDEKYEHKQQKYQEVQTFLRLEYPGFMVDQITLVMDVFGGYSKNLITNIEKVLSREETKCVVQNMQKSVIASEAHLCRVFKMRTLSRSLPTS